MYYIKIFSKTILGVVKHIMFVKKFDESGFINFSRTLDELGRSEIGL